MIISPACRRVRRTGFTLIELLVVIAIIAILAAILFPVFAQARSKARQSTSLSNENQIGLAMLQYVQDYDEKFPVTTMFNIGDPTSWVVNILPYIKNYGVFTAPEDSGPNNANFAWCGQGISYAVNGWQGTPNSNASHGVVALANTWAAGATAVSDAAITQPASSIMLAEHFSADQQYVPSTNWSAGNYVQFWPNNIFLGNQYYGGWGVAIPNDVNSKPGDAWPFGSTGGVSNHYGGTARKDAFANFLFVDGHTKAMKPQATNPGIPGDPTYYSVHTTVPGSTNMWDCLRQ